MLGVCNRWFVFGILAVIGLAEATFGQWSRPQSASEISVADYSNLLERIVGREAERPNHVMNEHDWMLCMQASYYANPDVFMKRKVLQDATTRDTLANVIHQTGAGAGMMRWGFREVEVFHRRFLTADTRGFIAYSQDTVLVAFCGSEPWEVLIDWWGTDANISLVEGDLFGVEGNIHSGFALASDVVYDDIRDRLAETVGDRRILITGHSLGGAIATLTAARLANEGFEIDSLYAYGNPATGDFGFSRGFAASGVNSVRTFNFNDPIPHFPNLIATDSPRSVAGQYEHVESLEIFFAEDTTALFNPSAEDTRLTASFGNLFELLTASQHATDLYLLLTHLNLTQEARNELPTPDFESEATRD